MEVYEWLNKVENNFWNEYNIKRYLIWLGDVINFKCEEDWYCLNHKILRNNYGSTISKKYKLIDLVRFIDKDYDWKEFKFKVSYIWNDIDKIEDYLKWLENKLRWNIDDWYCISKEILDNNYGSMLRLKYNLYDIPKILYPDYEWMFFKFNNVKKELWNIENIKIYLNWLKKEKNITDWYKLTKKILNENYGGYLAVRYNCYDLVRFVYDGEILEWKFETTTKFWKNKDNQIKYLKWLRNFYDYISYDILNKNYGSMLLKYYDIYELNKMFGSEIKHISNKQKEIYNITKDIFKDYEIILNDRKILNGLELDIWIPKLRIGIEYDGEQHYISKEYFGGVKSLKNIQYRDKLKDELCKELGINLIRIKYDVKDFKSYIIKKIYK